MHTVRSCSGIQVCLYTYTCVSKSAAAPRHSKRGRLARLGVMEALERATVLLRHVDPQWRPAGMGVVCLCCVAVVVIHQEGLTKA